MSHEGIQFLSPEEQEQKRREDQRASLLSRDALTPAKVRVLKSEGTGMEIDWADGHQSKWSFQWLRDGCPCATCVEERKQQGREPGQPKLRQPQLLQIYEAPARPSSAQAIGRYAIQFHWQDGHSSGIYSWDFLRRNCQCTACKATR
uniref:Gamma-butyrobetaine hydroxylase-like N-terminal domain-containing protein n=1 Tax=mine drainage metagenome TaxID=410659 RepID=E6PY32_9ZZZZ